MERKARASSFEYTSFRKKMMYSLQVMRVQLGAVMVLQLSTSLDQFTVQPFETESFFSGGESHVMQRCVLESPLGWALELLRG